jgi:hypothetical protein
MKLTKRDVAEGLGLTYRGTSWEYDSNGIEYNFHKFSFNGKQILLWASKDLDEAWEEAAEKLLEPLVDYLLGNLDDE